MVNIPNSLTLMRALGVPAFLYFFIVADKPLIAFLIIAAGGATDYLDGKIARMLNQTSDFGAKFDPTVDRLYIGAILIAFAAQNYLSRTLVGAILIRDLLLMIMVIYQKVRKYDYVEVSYLGKAATFNLLYAFPLLLLKDVQYIGAVAYNFGWAFAIWGVGLYFYTGIQYLYRGLFSARRG
jgi:cardiolipin synthase